MKYINIDIHWLGHDGFMIKGEKTIFIDPIQLSENITDKADILLITHTHGDHVSIEDIKKIVKKDTIINEGKAYLQVLFKDYLNH